jgi:predicted Zn-dependent protease
MTDVFAEYERAQAFFDAGQPAEAVGLLDRVLEAAPGTTAARELRARALFASAQLGRAEQAVRDLLERDPSDAWARVALARTLERQGRADEAAAQWRIADALGA